jgi:ABC-2 type transport system permease protein
VKKVLYVAGREFTATVLTKGFIFGVVITPAMIALFILFLPKLITKAPPKVEGRVAVVDPSGVVAEQVRANLTPQRFAERRARERRRFEASTGAAVRQAPGGEAALQQSLDMAMGEVPKIEIVALPPGTDVEAAKTPLKAPAPKGGADASTTLALVVVHPDAVRPAEGSQEFGTYDLFIRTKLDDRVIDDLNDAIIEGVIAARLTATGLDPARIKGMTHVEKPGSRTVTAEGEQTTNEMLNVFMPAAFMILLLVSVLTTGQYLLTSTVEEKSNRVVEVLLSAVSAMELMTGKILGQMAVGLLILLLYAGLGILALFSFATVGLLDPMLIIFLMIFYVLSFFTVAAMMAAIGAAVNEMREAQALQGPVMLFLMVPWILWLPIVRDPNSTMSVVLSFIPPLGNFAMLLRMTSTSPPPMWQAWLAIFISAVAVYGALWVAAKVFRVGLLMFGKPPTFGTLIRWARMS